MSVKSEQNTSTIISSIQKVLLYILVVILPISILPFPWDLTEKGMILVIFLFTILIVGLELFKILWTGKILFLKRDIDLLLFLLLISFILTTIFAHDTNLSIFGYDYRLSAGLLGLGSILLLTFISRSFLSSKKDLLNLFNSFLIGSVLTSLLSMISLFGGNIFNIIPKIGLDGKERLATLSSPILLVIYNSISILLGYITFKLYKVDDEKMDSSWFSIVAIFVNIVSLLFFSTDRKAFLVTILFTLIWLLVLSIFFFSRKKLKLKDKLTQLILPISVLLLSGIFQIKSIQNLLMGDTSVLSPVTLSLDASWQVVSQSLMESLKNGIVGMGLDSFGVIFTTFKPVELVNVNLVHTYNEILTSLSNGGFLWLVIWLILGWYILRDLIVDLKKEEKKSDIIILFDTLLLFVYITSFITTYSAILRFTFFLLISSSIVLRSIYNQQEVDSLLLKMWTMRTGKNEEKSFPLISVFFSTIISILMIVGIWSIGRTVFSSVYILRAESYISAQNEKLGDREPTEKEQKDITNNLYRWYSIAYKNDRKNPLINRKASIVAVDKLSILMQEYENEKDEDILNEAVKLRNEAFEYSRNAINLSPSLYAGYNNRALVYLGVINLGYTEYVRDAISVIDEAIEIKPLDYQNYYNKGQLYYLLQNYDLALKSSTQALSIKGDYIPALILSANINGVQGNTEIQLSYLEAVKTIMETNNLQDLQLYKDIEEQIETISTEEETTTDQTQSSEDGLETEQ